jgi:hypothetical protein
LLAHRRRAALLPRCFQLLAASGRVTAQPARKRKLVHLHGPCGLVRNAAGRWSSSNRSAPLSFDYGPRQFPPRNNDDTIFLITTPTRNRTPRKHVCPPHLPLCRETVDHPVTKTGCKAHRKSILFYPSFLQSHGLSKTIASAFQTGFLQVAVSKTLRRWASPSSLSAVAPECFRYSPKTSGSPTSEW